MNHRERIATGLIIGAVLASTTLASTTSGATLNLTLTDPASGGGLYNSAGFGSSANLVPGDASANPQSGGFIQIIHDGSKDGIGSAQLGGTGLANPSDDIILGTFYVGQGGTFTPLGDWGTLTLDPIGLANNDFIVVRNWDVASPDQTTTGLSGDGSVPAAGSFYHDTAIDIGVSGNSIYTIDVANPTGSGAAPIVTDTQLIPEPTSIALFALGLAVIGLRRRVRKS